MNQNKFHRILQTLLPAVYWVWTGLILGVSFIATPVKFQAPNLTRPVALEIGKVTFQLFNTIEWGVVFAIVILMALSCNRWKKWSMPIVLILLLAIQTFWILPGLTIRANAVISGGTPPLGPYHWLYIITELCKLLFTILSALTCSKNEGNPHFSSSKS
ncbi:MAG: DUF4149 domain-containing protein [Waddliaceae bacterium]